MSTASKSTVACHRHDLAHGGLQAYAMSNTDEMNRQGPQITEGSASALIHQCVASNVGWRHEPIRFNKVNAPMKAATPRAAFGRNGFRGASGVITCWSQIVCELIRNSGCCIKVAPSSQNRPTP